MLKILVYIHDLCVGGIYYFSSVSHQWCIEPAESLTMVMFTYNWLCIHFPSIMHTGDKYNDLHGYSFERALMKVSPTHDGKQTLIRGMREMCPGAQQCVGSNI